MLQLETFLKNNLKPKIYLEIYIIEKSQNLKANKIIIYWMTEKYNS